VEVKNGALVVGTTVPSKPALHTQPPGATLVPVVLAGHTTTEQPVFGAVVTVPENPALHLQPSGLEVPLLFAGQTAPVQVEM